ncbi:MAG: hypothetical protein ACFB15_25760 [Cyclobacteriaceae bacterium]
MIKAKLNYALRTNYQGEKDDVIEIKEEDFYSLKGNGMVVEATEEDIEAAKERIAKAKELKEEGQTKEFKEQGETKVKRGRPKKEEE